MSPLYFDTREDVKKIREAIEDCSGTLCPGHSGCLDAQTHCATQRTDARQPVWHRESEKLLERTEALEICQ